MFAALLAAAVGAIPSIALSPGAAAVIAPVHAAVETVRAAQAKLAPPASDGEALLRMQALDQAPRAAIAQIDFSKIAPGERSAAQWAIMREVQTVDGENQRKLLAMLPPQGWFTISRYGKDGSEAAFLIVQHAGPELWLRFLPALERLAAKGDVAGEDYARMFDRFADSEGRPQRFGTQFRCEAGRYVLLPLEDPAKADVWRASVGLPALAEETARFGKMPPC